MNKKKILSAILVIAGLSAGVLFVNNSKNGSEDSKTSIQQSKPAVSVPQAANNSGQTENNPEHIKQLSVSQNVQADSNNGVIRSVGILDGSVPYSAIDEISNLPENVQNIVKTTADSKGSVYMVRKNGNKVFMIAENPANIRHGIEFVEISIPSGHKTTATFGYNDKIKDSDNDIWEYDKVSEIQRPIRHTKYNNDGDMEFVEIWNYDENPIKYEMKDGSGNVISVRKETMDSDTSLRVEHLLYDKKGNTKVNVTTAFDNGNITRFTYYNADKISEGGSIFNEYADGVKTKETVYTSDLKVKNVYKPSYTDGVPSEVQVLDGKNNEIKKLTD